MGKRREFMSLLNFFWCISIFFNNSSTNPSRSGWSGRDCQTSTDFSWCISKLVLYCLFMWLLTYLKLHNRFRCSFCHNFRAGGGHREYTFLFIHVVHLNYQDWIFMLLIKLLWIYLKYINVHINYRSLTIIFSEQSIGSGRLLLTKTPPVPSVAQVARYAVSRLDGFGSPGRPLTRYRAPSMTADSSLIRTWSLIVARRLTHWASHPAAAGAWVGSQSLPFVLHHLLRLQAREP